VDLAGSERLDRSGATGLRAKEAAHINKSLSALAGIFAALHSKKTHVPYRDSKLTFLLQPALSGDGKTLLFVNLSPTAESAPESLCSLRFAKQVNSVELGKATRSIETFDPDKENTDAPTPKSSAKKQQQQQQPRLAR
jgi:kinesin family protein C1